MLRIDRVVIDQLGGEPKFHNDVVSYATALAAHAKTKDMPAPLPANNLVGDVVRNYNSDYVVFDAPQPPPPPPLPPPPVDDARVAGIKADAAYIDLFNRAQTSTAAQIDTWFTANVTTLAQARQVLSAIVKILAVRL